MRASATFRAALASEKPLAIVNPVLARHFPQLYEQARQRLKQFFYEQRANAEARRRLAGIYLQHTLENLPTVAASPDVSALDAVFLIHAFHPDGDITKPWYRIGDPVGRTDRQPVDPSTGRPFASSAPATEQPPDGTVPPLTGAATGSRPSSETRLSQASFQ